MSLDNPLVVHVFSSASVSLRRAAADRHDVGVRNAPSASRDIRAGGRQRDDVLRSVL